LIWLAAIQRADGRFPQNSWINGAAYWCGVQLDGWATTHQAGTTPIAVLNLWFADLPTERCPDGAAIEFTFFWKEAQRWEGRNFSVAVGEPK
jgi:hypothetical protein